jgi:hypothetical protein
LATLPPELGDLRNLTVLSLKGNVLENLPYEMGYLIKLQRLYLNDNCIQTIPESFKMMRNLKELDISKNDFEVFPEVLCNFHGLVHLKLSKNTFLNLPYRLSKLRSLVTLELINTKIIEDSSSVLSRMHWVELVGYDSIPMETSPSSLFHSKNLFPAITDVGISPINASLEPIRPLSVNFTSSVNPRTSLIDLQQIAFPEVIDPKNSPVGGIFLKVNTATDQNDLIGFLRHRASSRITAKLRRRNGKRYVNAGPII